MTYRDTNRTALPQRRFRIHACALCNMMETLRYTFVTHYLLMAGQAKWTDGSPVNVGPCFERNGGNIRDLFLFPIYENLPTKVNFLQLHAMCRGLLLLFFFCLFLENEMILIRWVILVVIKWKRSQILKLVRSSSWTKIVKYFVLIR